VVLLQMLLLPLLLLVMLMMMLRSLVINIVVVDIIVRGYSYLSVCGMGMLRLWWVVVLRLQWELSRR
jgi:hypothetical protein